MRQVGQPIEGWRIQLEQLINESAALSPGLWQAQP